MTEKRAIVAITKRGIEIAGMIKDKMPEIETYAPIKFENPSLPITNWFKEPTSQLVSALFNRCDALVFIFSLGAAIRLIAPLVKDKKTDPAVVVIDDGANFAISTLSGHLGGANSLARLIATFFDSCKPVITTAADVNETIAVDLLGQEFSWTIENFENVTKVSAMMVNEERIGVYQDAGEKNWWQKKPLPSNVVIVGSLEDLKTSRFKGAIVISDRLIQDPLILERSVIFRPKSLVVGLGVHTDTKIETIENGVRSALLKYGLSSKSIKNIASINRGAVVQGLKQFSEQNKLPVEVYDRHTLDSIAVPNPSKTVKKFEGTSSVSEASSIISSKGKLVVPKQKYPPDLTVAIARVEF